MKNRIAVILVITMLFTIVFGTTPVSAGADDESEYTDKYDGNSLLARYSTAEITAMYPEFSAYLAEEIRSFNTDISVSEFDLHKDDIGAIYFSVISENPDIFYVISTRFSSTTNYSSGLVLSIRPEYCFDIDEIPSKINIFNERVNLFLSGVDRNWSDVVKARYLHDILIHYSEYDTKYETIDTSNYEQFRVQMRIYNAYGALVDNNAVCEGYSMAYMYLLSQVGIKAYYIQSVKKHHAWNMVQIGNNYYHVDLAHDDPTYDNLGRVNHNNFLKSDNWFSSDNDNEHTNWVTNLKATDTTYDNAWWNNVNTMIYRRSGYDYYVNQRYTDSVYAAFTRRNSSTGVEELLSVLKTRWKVQGIENAFWDKAFSFLTADSQYFYYNDTKCVYRMAKDGTTQEKIYTKPTSYTNDIYGIAFKTNGHLYISIKETPNDKDIIYKLNIEAQQPTVTEPTEPTSDTGTTVPQDSTGGTDVTEPTAPQESTGSTGVTEPSSENITQPTATEAITSMPTEPVTNPPTVVKKSIRLFLNRSTQLTVKPKGAFKFSTSNKKIVTVTSSGLVTAKKAGKAVITAKSNSVIFKLTVNVRNPRLNYTKKTIKKKKTFTLRIVGGSGKITIKSSNPKVATINAKGKVVGKKKGKTTITIKVCGLKLKCVVTVK